MNWICASVVYVCLYSLSYLWRRCAFSIEKKLRCFARISIFYYEIFLCFCSKHTEFFLVYSARIYQMLQCKRTDKSEKLYSVVEVLLEIRSKQHSTHIAQSCLPFTATASHTLSISHECFSFHLQKEMCFLFFSILFNLRFSFDFSSKHLRILFLRT